MTNIPYVSMTSLKTPISKKDVTLVIPKNRWIWRRHRFDNHNMALMLIEILHSRNEINDATYRKIMKKYDIQNRIA